MSNPVTTHPSTRTVRSATADELRITALGIGHGDSILLQWRNETDTWTCLVDGGPSPDLLKRRLDTLHVHEIDLLVLTHLDTDHIGGLGGLAQDRRVGSFLGPALPAFERHLWLFGARGAEAIRRGRALEGSLREAGVEIGYPLEGYAVAPHPGGGVISVLSPAARLLRRLLTGDDVAGLFAQEPMPLGWLLDAEPETPSEEGETDLRLQAALSRRFLEPADLAGFPRGAPRSPGDARELVRSWSVATAREPEFFGDSVLNNTSLVLYFEVRTGSRTHRVLLPGDQENWTYLLARNPRGLHADVLKASHHGGRVYVESDEAHDELFSSVQPHVVLVSGNGRHGLPRAEIRQAAIRWGASVVCTCSRGGELISGVSDTSTCCHDVHACGEADNAVLILDAEGIRSDRPACHSGFGRLPGPIIQIRQHVVESSSVMGHLAEHELRRHIRWAKETFATIHRDRSHAASDLTPGSEPVSMATLETLARSAGRLPLIPHLGEMLRQGAARGAFWSAAPLGYSRAQPEAYALPSKADVEEFVASVRAKTMVLFPKPLPAIGRDPITLVHGLELDGLATFADATLHYPAVLFRDAFWPSLAEAFKDGTWHAFLHCSGAVALSTAESTDALSHRIVTPRLRQDDDRWWRVPIDQGEFPYGSILVSGAEERGGKPLDVSSQVAAVREWLSFRSQDAPPAYWSFLLSIGFKPRTEWGRIDSYIDASALASRAGGDVEELVALLAPSLEMLW